MNMSQYYSQSGIQNPASEASQRASEALGPSQDTGVVSITASAIPNGTPNARSVAGHTE